jgi:hypothetical protein
MNLLNLSLFAATLAEEMMVFKQGRTTDFLVALFEQGIPDDLQRAIEFGISDVSIVHDDNDVYHILIEGYGQITLDKTLTFYPEQHHGT